MLDGCVVLGLRRTTGCAIWTETEGMFHDPMVRYDEAVLSHDARGSSPMRGMNMS